VSRVFGNHAWPLHVQLLLKGFFSRDDWINILTRLSCWSWVFASLLLLLCSMLLQSYTNTAALSFLQSHEMCSRAGMSTVTFAKFLLQSKIFLWCNNDFLFLTKNMFLNRMVVNFTAIAMQIHICSYKYPYQPWTKITSENSSHELLGSSCPNHATNFDLDMSAKLHHCSWVESWWHVRKFDRRHRYLLREAVAVPDQWAI